ncbi:MAG: ribosomal RNA small subunit methyltransferase A [Rhodothermia bacterium]|nr:ribosomal RNA small subunit methyltransferase A [Rhodothermia bacterium]
MPNVPPKKSLGQHFLVDPNTARKIVESLRAGEDDPVVEIGPGMGALSGFLIERHRDVTGIEIDDRAAEHLRREYPDLTLRTIDVLTVDWSELAAEKGGPLHLIGNLPYNISSPILFGLFESAQYLSEAVVMMQLEVAQRLVGMPRTKQYGILSVAAQLVSKPELLFRVSSNVFRPRPSVTSAVVRLSFADVEAPVRYEGQLQRVIRTAFNQRRKTLRNSLKGITREVGIEVPEQWSSKRAEELAPEEFVALTRYLTR